MSNHQTKFFELFCDRVMALFLLRQVYCRAQSKVTESCRELRKTIKKHNQINKVQRIFSLKSNYLGYNKFLYNMLPSILKSTDKLAQFRSSLQYLADKL